jgi:hypothetical protein
LPRPCASHIRWPVARERLNRRELHTLRLVCDGFAIGPAGRVYASAQFDKLRIRKIHPERTNGGLIGARLLSRRHDHAPQLKIKPSRANISHQETACRTIRASAAHRDLCRDVPQDLSQLAGTDLVEEAVQLDMFRDCRARAKQPDIILDRLLEIHDGKAIVIKHRRDISVMMIVEILDEQLGRESRRAAELRQAIRSSDLPVHGPASAPGRP